MNHHLAAVGVIVAMVLTLWFLVDLGPYATLAFTFVAQPLLLFVIVFYYLAEVLKEWRRKDIL